MTRRVCFLWPILAAMLVIGGCDDEPDRGPDAGMDAPACMEGAMAGLGDSPPACAQCVCSSCESETQACIATDGCFADVDCVFQAIADETCGQDDTPCLLDTCDPDLTVSVPFLTCLQENCAEACGGEAPDGGPSDGGADAGPSDAGTSDAGTDAS